MSAVIGSIVPAAGVHFTSRANSESRSQVVQIAAPSGVNEPPVQATGAPASSSSLVRFPVATSTSHRRLLFTDSDSPSSNCPSSGDQSSTLQPPPGSSATSLSDAGRRGSITHTSRSTPFRRVDVYAMRSPSVLQAQPPF